MTAAEVVHAHSPLAGHLNLEQPYGDSANGYAAALQNRARRLLLAAGRLIFNPA